MASIAKPGMFGVPALNRLALVDRSDDSLVGKILSLSIGPSSVKSPIIEGTVTFAVVEGKQDFVAELLGLVNRTCDK